MKTMCHEAVTSSLRASGSPESIEEISNAQINLL